MKLCHLADLHLGHRRYGRLTSQGINQREADVAQAARRATDAILAAEPDAVLVAGDVFDSVLPGNHARLEAFALVKRLSSSTVRAIEAHDARLLALESSLRHLLAHAVARAPDQWHP